MNFLFIFIFFIFTNSAFAYSRPSTGSEPNIVQSTDNKIESLESTSAQSSDQNLTQTLKPKSSIIWELALTQNRNEVFVDNILESDIDSRNFYSFNISTGGVTGQHRFFFGLGVEAVGDLIDKETNIRKSNLTHLFYKLSYDFILAPVFTDIYLSASLQHFPGQGDRFTATNSNIEFAPEGGFGGEFSVGWLLPWKASGTAVNFGYRVSSRQYSYYDNDYGNFEPYKKTASLDYSGAFISLSIGRTK